MTEYQREFDKCYAIDDVDMALECLKELVGSAEGECRPKLVLLTQDNCTPCEEETALRQPDIDKGIIQVLSIDTDAGLAVATKNNIPYTPALVLLDCEGKLIEPSV